MHSTSTVDAAEVRTGGGVFGEGAVVGGRMVALEVSVNGKLVCTAALDGDSAVNAVISNQSMRNTARVNLSVFGVKTIHKEAFEWKAPFIDMGDEITIRVVDAKEPDPHPTQVPPKS